MNYAIFFIGLQIINSLITHGSPAMPFHIWDTSFKDGSLEICLANRQYPYHEIRKSVWERLVDRKNAANRAVEFVTNIKHNSYDLGNNPLKKQSWHGMEGKTYRNNKSNQKYSTTSLHKPSKAVKANKQKISSTRRHNQIHSNIIKNRWNAVKNLNTIHNGFQTKVKDNSLKNEKEAIRTMTSTTRSERFLDEQDESQANLIPAQSAYANFEEIENNLNEVRRHRRPIRANGTGGALKNGSAKATSVIARELTLRSKQIRESKKPNNYGKEKEKTAPMKTILSANSLEGADRKEGSEDDYIDTLYSETITNGTKTGGNYITINITTSDQEAMTKVNTHDRGNTLANQTESLQNSTVDEIVQNDTEHNVAEPTTEESHSWKNTTENYQTGNETTLSQKTDGTNKTTEGIISTTNPKDHYEYETSLNQPPSNETILDKENSTISSTEAINAAKDYVVQEEAENTTTSEKIKIGKNIDDDVEKSKSKIKSTGVHETGEELQNSSDSLRQKDYKHKKPIQSKKTTTISEAKTDENDEEENKDDENELLRSSKPSQSSISNDKIATLMLLKTINAEILQLEAIKNKTLEEFKAANFEEEKEVPLLLKTKSPTLHRIPANTVWTASTLTTTEPNPVGTELISATLPEEPNLPEPVTQTTRPSPTLSVQLFSTTPLIPLASSKSTTPSISGAHLTHRLSFPPIVSRQPLPTSSILVNQDAPSTFLFVLPQSELLAAPASPSSSSLNTALMQASSNMTNASSFWKISPIPSTTVYDITPNETSLPFSRLMKPQIRNRIKFNQYPFGSLVPISQNKYKIGKATELSRLSGMRQDEIDKTATDSSEFRRYFKKLFPELKSKSKKRLRQINPSDLINVESSTDNQDEDDRFAINLNQEIDNLITDDDIFGSETEPFWAQDAIRNNDDFDNDNCDNANNEDGFNLDQYDEEINAEVNNDYRNLENARFDTGDQVCFGNAQTFRADEECLSRIILVSERLNLPTINCEAIKDLRNLKIFPDQLSIYPHHYNDVSITPNFTPSSRKYKGENIYFPERSDESEEEVNYYRKQNAHNGKNVKCKNPFVKEEDVVDGENDEKTTKPACKKFSSKKFYQTTKKIHNPPINPTEVFGGPDNTNELDRIRSKCLRTKTRPKPPGFLLPKNKKHKPKVPLNKVLKVCQKLDLPTIEIEALKDIKLQGPLNTHKASSNQIYYENAPTSDVSSDSQDTQKYSNSSNNSNPYNGITTPVPITEEPKAIDSYAKTDTNPNCPLNKNQKKKLEKAIKNLIKQRWYLYKA